MKFLITGHNEFSIGMKSALEMIAGVLPEITAIPFLTEDSMEIYRTKIESELQESDSIICFTDLLGGTPFKTCVELSTSKDQVIVLSGTNLGMLLEGVALRTFISDPRELAQLIIQSGKDNITLFEEDGYIEELSDDGI